MYLESLGLDRYGIFSERSIRLGPGLTVVVGPNESGKSTALAALADLVWGLPQRHAFAEVVARAQVRLSASIVDSHDFGRHAGTARDGDAPTVQRLVRIGRGLFAQDGIQPVTNPWGADGEDHRESWLCCFGLSHQMLREGGQQILTGSGDLAELVFTARRGSAAQRLLRELDQQADQLFKAHRGNKGVLIRVAMEEYGRRTLALGEAVVRSSAVVAAQARSQELTEERDAAVARETEAHRTWSSLVERQRCLEPAQGLAAARRALGTVQARGVALDQDDLAVHDQAITDIGTARRQRDDLRAQIERLTAECQTLTVDDGLLADGQTFDALHTGLEARVGDTERSRVLLEDSDIRLEEVRRTIRSLTGRSEDRSVAELLDEVVIPADLATQLDEAAQRYAGLVAARETAVTRVVEERAALDEIPTARELPQPQELAPLREILDLIAGEQSPLVRVRAAQGQAREQWRECRLALVESGCLTPEGSCPVPPSEERLRQEIGDLEAGRQGAEFAAKRLGDAEDALAQANASLEELTGKDTIVEPQRLKDVRAERDELWGHLQRSWLFASPPLSAASAAGADTAAIFDRLLHKADHLADRLIEQAELVARYDTLRSNVAKAEADAATRRSDNDRAMRDCQDAERRWNRWWEELGVQAPSPTRAEAVRVSLRAATAASVHARHAEETVTATLPEVVTIAQRLRAVLTALNWPHPAPAKQAVSGQPAAPAERRVDLSTVGETTADLDLLHASALTLIDEVDQARENRARHRAAERALQTAQDKATQAEQAIDDWSQSWRSLLTAAGLPKILDPAGWQVRHQCLSDASATYAEAHRQRTEADGLLAAWTSFAEKVTELGRRHQATGDPAAILATLLPRLAESRANQRAHQDRRDAIATATVQKATLDETVAEARARLHDLRTRYAIADDRLLDAAADRGREIVELRAKERDQLGLLRAALDPGRDPEDMVMILTDADPADLDVQCSLARTELDQARQQREETVRELGAADQKLLHLAREGDAATQHALVQEQLAEVAALTERYAVVHLQRTLLRQQLAIDAQRHTSPLLDGAGRILQQLTDARWVALRANDDGADRRSLEILRGDQEPFAARALSEGTADQVFLAMRLASVIHRQAERHRRGQPPLPVVFDDVLMAFDDHRAQCALRAMADATTGLTGIPMQVVLFTHHAHLGELAEGLGRTDITVTRLAPPPALPGILDPDQVRIAAAQPRATAFPAAQRDGAAAASSLARMNAAIDERSVDPAEVRAWAKTQGLQVADRGRVPASLFDRYRAATGH